MAHGCLKRGQYLLSMTFTQGHALIIGVSTYPKADRLKKLPTAAEDALAVYDVLVDTQFCAYPPDNVEMLRGLQASVANIKACLAKLAQCNPGDTVLIYYSGHGKIAADKHFYLTACDTEFDDDEIKSESAVSDSELLVALRNIRAERLILLLNACHAGAAFPQSFGADTFENGVALEDSADDVAPINVVDAVVGTGTGRSIITACRWNERSYHLADQTTSFFADAVVDGLQGARIPPKDSFISLFDLYRSVYHQVTDAVSKYQMTQQPGLTVSQGIGEIPIGLYQKQRPQQDASTRLVSAAPLESVNFVSQEVAAKTLAEFLAGLRPIIATGAPQLLIKARTPKDLLRLLSQLERLQPSPPTSLAPQLADFKKWLADAAKQLNRDQRLRSLKMARQILGALLPQHSWLAPLHHELDQLIH